MPSHEMASALPFRGPERGGKEIDECPDARDDVAVGKEDCVDCRFVRRGMIREELDELPLQYGRTCQVLRGSHDAKASEAHPKQRHALIAAEPASRMQGLSLAPTDEGPAVQVLPASVPGKAGHAGQILDRLRLSITCNQIGRGNDNPANAAEPPMDQP